MSDDNAPTLHDEEKHEIDAPAGDCPVHDFGCRGPSWKCNCHLENDEFRREN